MLPSSARSQRPKCLSLFSQSEAYGKPVRRAVGLLKRVFEQHPHLSEAWAAVAGSRAQSDNAPDPKCVPALSSWAIVSIRLIARCTSILGAQSTLRDAEEWFLGSHKSKYTLAGEIPSHLDCEACSLLESFQYDHNLFDLLPYVLDPLGPGSRLSIRVDASTKAARNTKKQDGVFYTPPDVADYITGTAIRLHPRYPSLVSVLDPACGTGVFLRSALKCFQTFAVAPQDAFLTATNNLYGIDIDPLAVQAACFVLFADTFQAQSVASKVPWSVWHQLRLNLVVADALTVSHSPTHTADSPGHADLKARIAKGYVEPLLADTQAFDGLPLFSNTLILSKRFPALAAGVDTLIGNPPYATIGYRADAQALSERFETFDSARNRAKQDFYPLFVELMWQLTNPNGSSAGMVLPLSLSYHEGSQFTALRRAIASNGGHWRFAFFDREPHALFGEDVKTRNAIAFRTISECRSQEVRSVTFETGSMLKWRSVSRNQLFASISHTPLKEKSIEGGIPKLGTQLEYAALEQIRTASRPLSSLWSACAAFAPKDVSGASEQTLFVGSTAYNFLNVFFRHRILPAPRAPWSTNKVHAVTFTDRQFACAAFALLSSRLAFWLWRVHGDGFHVPQKFLSQMPFPTRAMEVSTLTALAGLGLDMWQHLQDHQIVAVNGGRQSLAYRPPAGSKPRDQIDATLVECMGLSPAFADFLHVYTDATVAGEVMSAVNATTE